MDTLFSDAERYKRTMNAPLAVRMRPQTLAEYVGQEQAVGPDSWLRRAIEHDVLSSIILFGPAGTGKTTLARIIANTTHAAFVEVSAVTGTVKDLRREIDSAESRLLTRGDRTILFVDEIHRFNRSQQDALLHAVEDRVVVRGRVRGHVACSPHHHARECAGGQPAPRAFVRQVRRHALRHHLGIHQVHAWQRPRRRGVLAGAHD